MGKIEHWLFCHFVSIMPCPLPDIFAVLRTQSNREPYWQILRATFSDSLLEVQADTRLSSVNMYASNSNPFGIYEGKFRLPSGEHYTSKFWYVSAIDINIYGIEIAAVDFEYKSWLPSPVHRVPVRNIEYATTEYRTAYNNFQRLNGLPLNERTVMTHLSSLPLRPPTPPRSRESSVESVESVLTVYQESTAKGTPIHLPETVGKLLLNQAWTSDESCPITASPFKELTCLSVTSCFHVFDSVSISEWQQTKNTCPVCRCRITNVITQERKN